MGRDGVNTLPDPPGPPDVRRSVSLPATQWIGIAAFAALPLLALPGLFGERHTTIAAQHGALDVSIRYPTILRYRLLSPIDLHIHNRGRSVLDTVTVALDSAFASRFSAVNAVPPFTGHYDVRLTDLAPRHQRHVRIEIRGERYWKHEGTLTIAARADTVRVPLTTVTFP